jgi:hypothetical protein
MQEPKLNRHDVEFLSILCGDVDGGAWGAWMTVCGEDLKSMGYVTGLYAITDKGLAYLDMLQFWDAPEFVSKAEERRYIGSKKKFPKVHRTSS